MTIEELRYRQSWTLFQKIDHAVGVISQFYSRLDGKVFVSFSGGKDSTVLLDIVRRFIDPDCLAVFCNTGNEHAEIVRFVKNTGNVQTIRPKTSLKKIIEKYGFPLISKEQALYIRQAKHTKSEVLRNIRLFGKKGRNGKYLTQGAISKKWQYLVRIDRMLSVKH
ncbi:phosphoadenosine phosphosulfate reductase domain-containing protein [Massilibacteroides vaginae]|uniref:phosphoadenosine phosphosulfate reductase domain-containing protein n=1 Tax=Massilibacteroides vaginae TaxID=1673718 RepID=UPI000A1CADBB|nr:phosphoadenosine phosphosulfate reductase family protein [Massilibacteroides vaginae]